MKYPNFLVVGTARSGTTSLHHYLRQHPGLYLPAAKEPCYYCFAGQDQNFKKGKFAFAITDSKKYAELFRNATESQIRGEVSTPYLYLYKKTISNILKFHPHPKELKILILLRNPSERAYSQYLWRKRDGREDLKFEEAIRQEPERMKKGYSFDYFYVDRGFYFRQVKAYMENFPKVKIVLLDDLKSDPFNMLKDICTFLGVDDSFQFDMMEDKNASYPPRWKFFSRVVTIESRAKFRILNQLPDSWNQGIRKQFNTWNKSPRAPEAMNITTRKMLNKLYHHDLVQLQSLIKRDLSAWLDPK